MDLIDHCAADGKGDQKYHVSKEKTRQQEHQNEDGCISLCSANSNLNVKPQS
jgi:hypothetical protein